MCSMWSRQLSRLWISSSRRTMKVSGVEKLPKKSYPSGRGGNMLEMTSSDEKILKITLVKSGIGFTKKHKATLYALGFRHLNETVRHIDSPSLRGLLRKVNHLVKIE